MPAEIQFPWGKLIAFALVLARVAGALSFVPIPGVTNSPAMARTVLALAITAALFPVWPLTPLENAEGGRFLLWIASEAAFGITVGVTVSFLNECFVLASQIFGLQAGYGYASMIDPATQADSSVLQVFSHLAAGLLFFSLGLHREVLRAFAESLTARPPGEFAVSLPVVEAVVELGSVMFTVAVRLALPVIAVLMLVDLSLALLGRINTQLQLLTLAFPVKMLISIGLLAAIAAALPKLYAAAAEPALRIMEAIARGAM